MTGLLIGLAVGYILGSATWAFAWWASRQADDDPLADDVGPDTWAAEAERLYRRQHREERPPLGDLEEWMGGATRRAIEP